MSYAVIMMGTRNVWCAETVLGARLFEIPVEVGGLARVGGLGFGRTMQRRRCLSILSMRLYQYWHSPVRLPSSPSVAKWSIQGISLTAAGQSRSGGLVSRDGPTQAEKPALVVKS